MNDTRNEQDTAPVPLTPAEVERQEQREAIGDLMVFLQQNLHQGRVALELARTLQQLTASVRKNNRRGSVTLKLTVEPVKGAMPGAVSVDGEVTAKIPQGARPRAVMFSTPDGKLSLDHPDQTAAFDIDGQAMGGKW